MPFPSMVLTYNLPHEALSSPALEKSTGILKGPTICESTRVLTPKTVSYLSSVPLIFLLILTSLNTNLETSSRVLIVLESFKKPGGIFLFIQLIPEIKLLIAIETTIEFSHKLFTNFLMT
ncbi:wsv158 [White spot syndrome virus]|uniref:Wsv158 n=4 Tax=White spot syndrome virus TaxID=342409 RepID=Q8VB39_WSSVS|nr:wsv158 [Shrimp white spot syndrome virus]AFX59536.1 wsv158 [White spot syndrome virus]AAL33162.1 wsv158 [Shrimp white spot syndrome virus]AAL89082.1 WSSV214 [Shrimp white spot syndrome virus]AWQ60340.1 wsv158 [Shrimp white spot syndrome virus]AWQ60753.1 wsv158 [Shrimp white spot syndrome virus]